MKIPLPFTTVERTFRVTIDTKFEPYLNVHLQNGTITMFKQYSGGIYYYDKTNMKNTNTNIQVTDYTFLNTVNNNKAYLRQLEIKVADEARLSQHLLGWPSTQTIKTFVKKSNQKLSNHHR